MVLLRAIIPQWVRVIDHQCPGRPHHIGLSYWHVARKEPGNISHLVADGMARVIESCLYDGVVLGVEVPLYHFAGGDVRAGGAVGQRAVLVGDFDDVDFDAAGAGGCGGT